MQYRFFLPDSDQTLVEIRQTKDEFAVLVDGEERVVTLDDLDGLELKGGILNFTSHGLVGGFRFMWNGKACLEEVSETRREDELKRIGISMIIIGALTAASVVFYTFVFAQPSLAAWTYWLIACSFPIARSIFYFVAAARLKEGDAGMAKVSIYAFFIFALLNFLGFLFFQGIFHLGGLGRLFSSGYVYPILIFRFALLFWFGYCLRKLDGVRSGMVSEEL